MARPFGSKNKFSVSDFSKEKDAQDFLAHVRKNYKKNDKLAVWYGDHLFGKAHQAMDITSNGEALAGTTLTTLTNEQLERLAGASLSGVSAKGVSPTKA